MKILSILNISNKDDIHCDSGYIFQRILSEQFSKNGDEYIVAASDCEQFKNTKNPYINKKYIKLGTNKYSSRFDFDSIEFEKLLKETTPDIIFNTQVELTSAIKSVLIWNKMDIPIVTYCHYPALWANNPKSKIPEIDESLNCGNIGHSILFDIFGALKTSDAFIIQSNFAKSLIEKAAKFHNIQYKNDIQVIAPPADPIFLDKNSYINRDIKLNFIYNHRLYKTYGTAEFIELFNKIYKKTGIKCIISDPMINRSKERQKLNSTPSEFRETMRNSQAFIVSNKNTNRNNYKKLLLQSFAGFAPLRRACVWSMASIDCMGLGIPVLAPNYAAFPEFIPPELIYKDYRKLETIVNRLINDEKFRYKMSKKCFYNATKFSAEKIANKFNKIFIKVLKAKKCVV